VITERVPVHDVMEIRARARERGVQFVGPNTPGIITPGEAKMGIMPGTTFTPGHIGIISRSGTLSYELSADLAAVGLGQSTVVGMGGDPVVFTNMPELLELFEKDPNTELVVIIGEVGGAQRSADDQASGSLHRRFKRPRGEADGSCRRHYPGGHGHSAK